MVQFEVANVGDEKHKNTDIHFSFLAHIYLMILRISVCVKIKMMA